MTYSIDKAGIVSDTRQCPSPNYDDRPNQSDIDTLIIHAISLPPDQFGGPHVEELFTNSLDPDAHSYFKDINHLRVSSHLLIDRKGNVIQFVPLLKRAWHAGESVFDGREVVNDFSIGIELEGCDTAPFEAEQYVQLSLLTYSIQRFFSAIKDDRIVGHSDIAPGRKTDPGPCFDWALFRRKLAALGAGKG